jgi:hypothetical protein
MSQPILTVDDSGGHRRHSEAVGLVTSTASALVQMLATPADKLSESSVERLNSTLQMALYRLDGLLEEETSWAAYRPDPEVLTNFRSILQGAAKAAGRETFKLLQPNLVRLPAGGVAYVYTSAADGTSIVGSGHTISEAIDSFELACTQNIPAPQPQESPEPSKPAVRRPRRKRSENSSPSDAPTDSGSTGTSSSSP